ARRPYQEPAARHDLGRMDVECRLCHAFHWEAEKTVASSKRNPKFGMCCDHGQVQIPLSTPPPDTLLGLLEGDDSQAKEFRENIRQYNMALAFTSLGVTDDKAVNRRGGWVFRILGQLSHNSAALEPPDGTPPSFSQLYIYDPAVALRQRMHRNGNLRHDTMQALQTMLLANHRYAPIYKHAHEVLSEYGDAEDVEIRLRLVEGRDRRRYNLPTAEEVAVILPGDGSEGQNRDIILRRRMLEDASLHRIWDSHPAYAPLHYVLLFPRGEHGWHKNLLM
ncbi:hypothetical protein FPV67DRAFT_1397701, partial [Lyophyllum atratum]